MSLYRQHYKPEREAFWTPIRILFAITYLMAFITLYCVL